MIEAPEFDSLGRANDPGVAEYRLTGDPPPAVGVPWTEMPWVGTPWAGMQWAGMQWAEYPGASFWDAHGYFVLRSDVGPPSPGLYGAPLRLVDGRADNPLEASDAFVLPLLFDPSGAWTASDVAEGLSAFEANVIGDVRVPGDFNDDGTVDASDYAAWSADFGQPVSTPGAGADGNADGLVNLADYTVWRDHAVLATAEGRAIPEPMAAVLGAVAVCLSRMPRRAFFTKQSFPTTEPTPNKADLS
ncbi:MAG: dockerin type I domain-containing protein [Planctomycetota bacterium]